jgi:peptidoglycan/LPS O-acetylase OafA/YrhL
VLVILALFTRKADTLFVVLAWMFVASRLAHAAIHVTSNHLQRRFFAFLIGAIVAHRVFEPMMRNIEAAQDYLSQANASIQAEKQRAESADRADCLAGVDTLADVLEALG